MHQTVHTFFSRPDGPIANSSMFSMIESDACLRISTTCIRYLMLCAARSAPSNEPPNTKSWKTVHFKKYAKHLHERPLIDYALNHFELHKTNCVLGPKQHKNDCSQCVNDEQLVSQLSDYMANNLASLLFNSWIDCYLGRGVAVEKGRTPAKDFRNKMLHTATRMQYSQLVETLLTIGANKESRINRKTPLLVSAMTGDVTTARVLLRKRAHTDAKDNNEQTAFLLAAAKGHDTILSILVSSGANKAAKDAYGRTALHRAASNGHSSTVQLLVETFSADKDAKDSNGWTALHHAASNGQYIVVQLLVETIGASTKAIECTGSTPLHFAAIWGHESTVQLLLTCGANREAEDLGRRTALHWAAIFGRTDIVKLLVIEFGSNKEAEDHRKHTALHFAAPLGHESTVQLLVNKLHVNAHAKNENGKTALDISREM